MNHGPHLLLIGGWTQTLQKALDNGFRVSYFGPVQSSPTFDAAILACCAHVRAVEVDRIGICLALAQDLHAADPFIACLSYTERGLETAAVIAAALGVRGMALWPVAATRYKDWMRQLLDGCPGLALPWRRVATPEALRAFHREHGPDIIVKPLSGAGGAGVQRLHSVAELDAFAEAHAACWPADLLAEEFVASDDLYSVETLTLDGQHHVLGMSFSKMTGYPYACQSFVMVPPPDMPAALREAVAECTRRFLGAMRLDWGVAHTEVKIRQDGRPAIIESQTRVGGDRIWRMLELTTGFRQIDAMLRSLIEPVACRSLPETTRAAAFLGLYPPAGRIQSACAPDFPADLAGVLEWRLEVRAGDMILAATDSLSKRGFVLLQADNHASLLERIAAVCARCRLIYEDGRCWQPSFELQASPLRYAVDQLAHEKNRIARNPAAGPD